MNSDLRFEPFDPHTAPDSDFVELTKLFNTFSQERDPLEAKQPLEAIKGNIRNLPPFLRVAAWGVWHGEGHQELVGEGHVVMPDLEENRHLAEAEMYVMPGWRRRGIATHLLRLMCPVAEDDGRRLLAGMTSDSIPAGETLLRKVGGEVALENHSNYLELGDVDRSKVAMWQERARERASDFELGLWDGPYPEGNLQEVSEMKNMINDIPTGTLEMEDFHFTPAQIREMDKGLAESGGRRWTLYVRDRSTGVIAGFTEVAWHPARPQAIEQYGTCVSTSYRNRGLGRWMKAAMLDKILRELPEARRITTRNADTNEAMLNINRELGFKPGAAVLQWQVEVEKVKSYLTEKGRERPALAGKAG